MGEVETAGGSLFWMEEGRGLPVVFVHGIPTDFRAWQSQLDAVAPEFRAISYSRRYAFPNHRTGDVSDSTVPANADDLVELVEKLGVAPVHLVGHSYGGFIAAYLAVRRPDLVRSLVLVEPAIASLLLLDPASRGQAFRLFLRSPSTALAAARYLKTSHTPAMAALQRGDLATAVRLNVDGVEGRSGAFDALSQELRTTMIDNGRTVRETDTPYPPLSRTDLGRIQRPTRVISGQMSALWLRRIAATAVHSIPGADLCAIAGSGHYPHVQQPERFNQLLLEFLRSR